VLRAVRVVASLLCCAAGGYLVAWSVLALDYYVASSCALLAPMRLPNAAVAIVPVLGALALARFGPRLTKVAGATLGAGALSLGLAAAVMALPG